MSALLNALYSEKLTLELSAGRYAFPTTKFRHDPVGFCTEVLGFAPSGKQIEVLEAVLVHDRVAIPAGRKVGKSRILAAIALWWYAQWEDATVVICAPCERQITEITWYDLVGLYHESGRCLACRLRDPEGPRPCEHATQIDGDLSASVRTGLRQGQRRVVGMAPRNSDNARGISGPHQLWLIDEASGVARPIYEAADGNRASGAKIVVAGNPTSRATWFFDACEKMGFYTITIPSTESPNVKLGRKVVPGMADTPWIDEKKTDYGEDDPRYQVEVKGEFPTREAQRIVSDVELASCFERHEGGKEDVSERLYVGIDPAGGHGGDKSTIVVRRGARVLTMVGFNGATDRIMGELDVLLLKHRTFEGEPVVVNYDASSTWGADLTKAMRLRRAYDDALTFHALEARGDPKRDPVLREARCARLADAYWMNLSIRLRSDAQVPFSEDLRVELLFAEWREDEESGHAKLVSKREYRKKLGRSPDLADALAYAFWEGRVTPASAAASEYREQRRLQAPPQPGPIEHGGMTQDPFAGLFEGTADPWWPTA